MAGEGRLVRGRGGQCQPNSGGGNRGKKVRLNP